MLGRTAGGLFWMFRYLERSENMSRLLEAGFRIALTRPTTSEEDWGSILASEGTRQAYLKKYESYDAPRVIDFVLRDRANPSSVMSVTEAARNNARSVRTAITREVWEATNECWMVFKEALARPVREQDLPSVLRTIRQQSALVRGALHGTMLRNDIFNFARLGTFIERSDNTARILDFKYYVLLPSVSYVGSTLDNVQWETILRSVSALRAYRWLNKGQLNPKGIAEFLILDERMPRSLTFCQKKLRDNLGYLQAEYGQPAHCLSRAILLQEKLENTSIDSIFDRGLHEFLQEFVRMNNSLGQSIEKEYRFYE